MDSQYWTEGIAGNLNLQVAAEHQNECSAKAFRNVVQVPSSPWRLPDLVVATTLRRSDGTSCTARFIRLRSLQ